MNGIPAESPAGRYRAAVRTRGFTLVEMLVALAVIGLLLSIALPALASTRAKVHLVGCTAAQRKLAVGVFNHTTERKGKFPGPHTEPGPRFRGNPWVLAFDPPGQPLARRLDAQGRETAAALEAGSLWPFVGDAAAYRSPRDPTDRLRSYSLSVFLAGSPEVGDHPDLRFGALASRIDSVRDPSGTLAVVAEEDPDHPRNRNAFTLDLRGSRWIDLLPDWGPGRHFTAAMLDGSTLSRRLGHPRLRQAILANGPIPPAGRPVDEATRGDFEVLRGLLRIDR